MINVTGCIVTHNNKRTIVNTIKTLTECTKGVSFRLFIVDNSSTDGTPELIKKNFGELDNIEIILTGTNEGFGAGHNFVIDRLDSEFHVIINPDVILRDDIITKMADYMSKDPDIGLLSPRVCFPDGRDQILGKRDPKLKYLIASRLRNEKKPSKALRQYAMLDDDLSKPCDIENATGCFMMLRTELFKEIGGFDQKYFMYFEDCDITRTVRKTHRAVYYPDTIIYHVWGHESKKNMKLMLVQIRSMFYYFFKWRCAD
ncbi:MAG: glycosyltransferase family 2 protein [Clostridiales bacterium]|nr:glycosyltransferase family 2 protein [Clostridiales bacterium]